MRATLRICILPVLLLLVSPSLPQSLYGEKEITAAKVQTGPRLDGELQEDCWDRAAAVQGFFQKEPREGAKALESTEVKVIYDGKNLYGGICCYDSEPEKIIATQMQRDGELRADDNFTFVLDTFHDRRNAFYFQIKPNGAGAEKSFAPDSSV